MNKAKLDDLINIEERLLISKRTNINLNSLVEDLTVKNLSDISGFLINTESRGQLVIKPCILSAKTIEILTERAIKINKSIL